MKSTYLSTPVLFLGSAMLLFSCSKSDALDQNLTDESISGKKDKEKNCAISSVASTSSSGNQTLVNVIYSQSGKIQKVETGIYSGGIILSTAIFDVRAEGRTISFLEEGTNNVVLLANLNNKGKVISVEQGNAPNSNFLPAQFEYQDNRVKSMSVALAGNVETSRFNYDQRGNVLSVEDDPTTSVPVPGKTVYSYGQKKVKAHLYIDEPRKFSWNSLTLLQYVGLFPELECSNERVSTKVWWGNNYQAANNTIRNSQTDNNGRLTSYEIVHEQTGIVMSKISIGYDCNARNPSDENDN